MQENKVRRTDFGRLISRGWSLCGKCLGATYPVTLLCILLPALIVTVVMYYCILTMFQPVFRIAQTVLQSLLTYGFDEWAIGSAVEQVLISMGNLTFMDLVGQMLGSLGGMAILVIVMIPVQIICQVLFVPMGYGAMTEAHSRAWHGISVGFKGAFAAVKKHMGRLVVLNLIHLLAGVVLSFLTAFAAGLLALIPVAGPLLAFAAAVGLLALLTGVRDLMLLIAVNEGKWHFKALAEAVKRFFTDWAYVSAGALFALCMMVGVMLIAVLDVLLMVLAMFPPVLTLMFMAFCLPLGLALNAVLYYDQRKRAGYALACALE